jgi:hypothetical protein
MRELLKDLEKIDIYQTLKEILTSTIVINLFLLILDFGNLGFNIFFLFSLIIQLYVYYINF